MSTAKPISFSIICTGDELLRGDVSDHNGGWMAGQLDACGIPVDNITIVSDDIDTISQALNGAMNRSGFVVCCGGLGPTDDDVTAAAAAHCLGVSLATSEIAAAQVLEAFARIDRPMAQINLKQAFLPSGCEVLLNEWGTAPGFLMPTPNGGRAFFLPGPPRELEPMFRAYVLPNLPLAEAPVHRARCKTYGIGESDAQTRIRPIADAFADLRWSFRATFPELAIMISGPDDDQVRKAFQDLERVLHPHIFTTVNATLPEALGRELAQRGLTIATAESCTGGLIGHSLTEIPGSSAFFLGGIISYNNSLKRGILGVPDDVLLDEGAVSEAVVRAMAIRAKQLTGADVTIAVSGIAGPGGGTLDKPVGLVHFAVAHPGGIEHKQKVFGGLSRSRVKKISAWTALYMALCAIAEVR